MILINKKEAFVIRGKYPSAEIIRTCVQKSKRHKYYLAERDKYLRLIAKNNREAASILEERNCNRKAQNTFRLKHKKHKQPPDLISSNKQRIKGVV